MIPGGDPAAPSSSPPAKTSGESHGSVAQAVSEAQSSSASASGGFKVVIVGGGVAALEAGLALRDLAGERVSLTLVAPEPDFVYRPMTVRKPFAYAAAQHYPLGDIVKDIGAELIVDRFAWVDASGRVAHTDTGTDNLERRRDHAKRHSDIDALARMSP